MEDALAAAELLGAGPVVDVGSGGGSPGIPLAHARPDLHFDLLESQRKKCLFLEEWTSGLANAAVVCARAEEHARERGRDAYGTAVARALAPVPVALEWCLPLVRVGGRLVLYAGNADLAAAERVADRLGARPPEVVPVRAADRRQLLLFAKVRPTPAGFPRRPGLARKRPLA